ncbi:hypothetical protein [Cyanobium sp. ATX-6F1]|uniref:hypothetical protein n=1 Tax=Cyanobium sp. ATX-6F1 TaxID=3137388 RepID=UPI0039BEB2B3
MIRAAVALGLRSFGESRLQEAQAKQGALGDLEPLDWHFIGRLQANKARGCCAISARSIPSTAWSWPSAWGASPPKRA